MWWTTGKTVFKIYVILWMVAVGGIVGSNIAGLFSILLIASENKSEYVQPWVHAGWIVGTVLAAVGAVTGKLKMISGKSTERNSSDDSSNTQENHLERQPAAKSSKVNSTTDKTLNSKSSKPSSLWGAILGIGFFGGLFGLIFGASLLVFWFSLNYSPFAVKEWAESVQVVKETTSPGRNPVPTKTSDHPIAIYLVAIPTLIGILIGATVGAVGAAFGKVHDG